MRLLSLPLVFLAACSGAIREEGDLASSSGAYDMAASATLDLRSPPGPTLVLNEAYPHGADELTDPDWIEIKNLSSAPVSLAGYALADDAMTPVALPDVVVASNAYAIVLADDAPDGGAATAVHLPFKLGKTDSLTLSKAGVVIDTTSWTDVGVPSGKSWARLPDGQGSFATATPTKLAANAP